jgi:hypothetical protein
MQPIYQRYERHAVAVARQYVPRRVADLALEPMGQAKRLIDDRLAGHSVAALCDELADRAEEVKVRVDAP